MPAKTRKAYGRRPPKALSSETTGGTAPVFGNSTKSEALTFSSIASKADSEWNSIVGVSASEVNDENEAPQIKTTLSPTFKGKALRSIAATDVPIATSLDSATFTKSMRSHKSRKGAPRYSVLSPPLKDISRNRKRGICGTPVDVIKSLDTLPSSRFANVEGLSPDVPCGATTTLQFDEASDEDEENEGRRSRTRIFSPPRNTSTGEDHMDDALSPPPMPARSLSESSPFVELTPAQKIMKLPSTTLDGVKFALKNVKNSRKKKAARGPPEPVTIVPPSSWDVDGRKAKFIEWGCSPDVGFGLRSAGGGVVFLQIPAAKVEGVFTLLEEVLDLLKGKTMGSPLRRRSNTYPPNKQTLIEQPGTSVDMIVDSFGTLSTNDPRRIPRPPRPSYSPLHNNSVHMTEAFAARRRLSSPLPPAQPQSNHYPPQPALSPKFSAITSATETPMIKTGYWGSRPSESDWGISSPAPQESIQVLVSFLNDADAVYGSGELSIGERYKFADEFEKEAMHEESEEEDEGEDSFGELPKMGGGDDLPALGGSPEPVKNARRSSTAFRRSSVGASVLASMVIDGDREEREKKKRASLAKHRRVSIAQRLTSGASGLMARMSSFRGVLQPKLGLPQRIPVVNVNKTARTKEAFDKNLGLILSFLSEEDLLTRSSLVCSNWMSGSIDAQAQLMLISVGGGDKGPDEDIDSDSDEDEEKEENSVALSMKRDWGYISTRYNHATFLSEGAFKRVYRVRNTKTCSYEALSVMDLDVIESTGNESVVAAELAVGVMLGSLVRRGVCPNFILTRRTFTCENEPPAGYWGDAANKAPRGKEWREGSRISKSRPGKGGGRFQYISMELCSGGDVEDWLAQRPNKTICGEQARDIMWQMAFSLFAAKEKFGLKHYDIKNLNFLLQDCSHEKLRYGLDGKVFEIQGGIVAKLADYGTAVFGGKEGASVSMANFTTLENTPMDYLIMGESAVQGHGHDNWGLGLCLFHLMSGHMPYEEVLEDVKCGKGLRKELESVWEGGEGFDVIKSLINAEVYEEGDEKDFTLHDTLYRYLVLLGSFGGKGIVWDAIQRGLKKDKKQFDMDVMQFSLDSGVNEIVAGARTRILGVEGAMDCLRGLLHFDADKRWSSEDVLKSKMMEALVVHGNIEANSTSFMHWFNRGATTSD